MRLVVQRVEKAKVVKVDDGSTVGEIGKGLLVLAGVKKGDTPKFLSWKDIKEVIVINDGSRDLTSKKLQNYIDHHKCDVISTVKNKGKGWAIATGINEARGNVVLMCDADLALIDISHIENLIKTFKKDHYQMVIASRGPITGVMSRFFASLSGERIFYKKNLRKIEERYKYLNMKKKRSV